MQIPVWLEVIIMLLFFTLFCILPLTYFFFQGVIGWMSRQLKKNVFNGLSSGDVCIEDFYNLQKEIGLTDRQTHAALMSLKAKVDFGNLSNKEAVKPRLDTLITEFSAQQPYSDLPEEVKNGLVNLKSSEADDVKIDALADKIRIFIKRQKRSDFWLKVATYIGLFVGLVGMIWGFYK